MPQSKSSLNSRTGCGYLLLTGTWLTLLLMGNVWLVRALGSGTLLAADRRIFEAAQLIIPIMLVFFQIVTVDWIKKRWFPNR